MDCRIFGQSDVVDESVFTCKERINSLKCENLISDGKKDVWQGYFHKRSTGRRHVIDDRPVHENFERLAVDETGTLGGLEFERVVTGRGDRDGLFRLASGFRRRASGANEEHLGARRGGTISEGAAVFGDARLTCHGPA